MARVISIGNFKGGVGKTTTTVFEGYETAALGYKTLVIDMDVSRDGTEMLYDMMADVYGKDVQAIIEGKDTFFSGLSKGDLSNAIIPVMENLDLLPSDGDLVNYPDFLNSEYEQKYEKVFHFKNLLDKIKDDYDYIFIDVPPTINNMYVDSAIAASEYMLIVVQTQMKSLRKAIKYATYLEEKRTEFDLDFRALGVLAVLWEKDETYDSEVLELIYDNFGRENVYETTVRKLKRIKRYEWTGITNNPRDPHDRTVHSMYTDVAKETIRRIEAEING